MCDHVTARVSILKRDHDGIGIEKQDYNSGLKTHAVSEHWKVWLRTYVILHDFLWRVQKTTNKKFWT
jgi:hypothetical protein